MTRDPRKDLCDELAGELVSERGSRISAWLRFTEAFGGPQEPSPLDPRAAPSEMSRSLVRKYLEGDPAPIGIWKPSPSDGGGRCFRARGDGADERLVGADRKASAEVVASAAARGPARRVHGGGLVLRTRDHAGAGSRGAASRGAGSAKLRGHRPHHGQPAAGRPPRPPGLVAPAHPRRHRRLRGEQLAAPAREHRCSVSAGRARRGARVPRRRNPGSRPIRRPALARHRLSRRGDDRPGERCFRRPGGGRGSRSQPRRLAAGLARPVASGRPDGGVALRSPRRGPARGIRGGCRSLREREADVGARLRGQLRVIPSSRPRARDTGQDRGGAGRLPPRTRSQELGQRSLDAVGHDRRAGSSPRIGEPRLHHRRPSGDIPAPPGLPYPRTGAVPRLLPSHARRNESGHGRRGSGSAEAHRPRDRRRGLALADGDRRNRAAEGALGWSGEAHDRALQRALRLGARRSLRAAVGGREGARSPLAA